MKCNNCGAEIGLLDKFCPYCGSTNTESRGHIGEMKHYKKENKETQKAVKKSISQNARLIILGVALVLLVVGNAVFSDIAENGSLNAHRAKRSDALRKQEEYSETLRQLLQDEDYTGFVAYKELHVIPEYEEGYKEFENVWEIAKEYNGLINNIEEVSMFGPEAPKYGLERSISSLKLAISSFYREYDYRIGDYQDDPYLKNMEDMKEKADLALAIYLGLDDEAREEYLASSEIKQAAYLTEVLIND